MVSHSVPAIICAVRRFVASIFCFRLPTNRRPWQACSSLCIPNSRICCRSKTNNMWRTSGSGSKTIWAKKSGAVGGAHYTSADAAVMFQRTNGQRHIVLIEWKYTDRCCTSRPRIIMPFGKSPRLRYATWAIQRRRSGSGYCARPIVSSASILRISSTVSSELHFPNSTSGGITCQRVIAG